MYYYKGNDDIITPLSVEENEKKIIGECQISGGWGFIIYHREKKMIKFKLF